MNTQISRRGFLCAAGIASASAALTACGGSSSSVSSVAGSAAASSETASGESVELIVFAAASLTETLNAIAETYSAENPGVTFRFNFDSSGTLKTQIQEGAEKLLLIDDSIVRGTQLRETTEFLYKSGAKEVHIRPACPPLVYGCKFLNFSRSSSEMDLITRRVIARLEGTEDVSDDVLQQYADPDSPKYEAMVEEIRKELNFTSLRYNRLDDMLAAVGIPEDKLCTYCWNGKDI